MNFKVWVGPISVFIQRRLKKKNFDNYLIICLKNYKNSIFVNFLQLSFLFTLFPTIEI